MAWLKYLHSKSEVYLQTTHTYHNHWPLRQPDRSFSSTKDTYVVSKRVEYERQAISLVWQPEGCQITQASLEHL